MHVDGRALLDQRIDVGHGDVNPDGAVSQPFAGRQLIEVERIVVVDRTPRQRPQIADLRVDVPAGPRQAGQLLPDTRREFRLRTPLCQSLGRDAHQIRPRPLLL